MNNIQLRQIIKIIISSILLLTLTSCATYKSSFNCGDAKGAYCASMDSVDQMIKSGEIERFNEQRQKRQKYKLLKNSEDLQLSAKQEKVEHVVIKSTIEDR